MEDSYPTNEELDHIRHFHGTPQELVDLIRDLFGDYGSVTVTEDTDDYGRDYKIVQTTTGGWSGCEDVNGALSNSAWDVFYWNMSKRGGLTVYHVPAHLWEEPRFLGKMEFYHE